MSPVKGEQPVSRRHAIRPTRPADYHRAAVSPSEWRSTQAAQDRTAAADGDRPLDRH